MKNRQIFLAITAICLAASVGIIFGVMSIWRYAPAPAQAAASSAPANNQNLSVPAGSQSLAGPDAQELSAFGDEFYTIVILGDSIARGRGDQSGAGLVRAFPAEINQQEVRIINAGIDGLVSSELPGIIANPELSAKLASADLFIISIGGNDLRRLAFNALQGRDLSTASAEYRDTLNEYLSYINETFSLLRADNQTAKIMMLGLFNPFEAEELSGLIPRDAQIEVLFDWNHQTAFFTEQDPRALWIPSYDLFKWNIRRFLSFDFIHPSEDGYQIISERMFVNLLHYE